MQRGSRRVAGRRAERHRELGLAGMDARAERVLLRPELGADGGLQPGRQVAQDDRGHEQQTAQHAGQGQERAAVVFGRGLAAVVYVLGHDHRVLDVLLELGEVRRVGEPVRCGIVVVVGGRAVTVAVAVHVPSAPAPVPGRFEQVQTVFLWTENRPAVRKRSARLDIITPSLRYDTIAGEGPAKIYMEIIIAPGNILLGYLYRVGGGGVVIISWW